MHKPNILIVGPTGSGKSTSLRNLDPEHTIILNCERKVLPFRNAGRFTKQVQIDRFKYLKIESDAIKNEATRTDFIHWYNKALKMENIDVIIIESLTTLLEFILVWNKRVHVGYDVWDGYRLDTYDILQMSKNRDKFVVFTSIDMIFQDDVQKIHQMASVDGKALKGGKIEKEFLIVLFTKLTMEENKIHGWFLTNNDGFTSAKSPMEMLDFQMPNDLNEVLIKSNEYYQMEEKESQ